jgi:hypothetical protein
VVPGCWGEIETTYQRLEQLFEHLQAIYRPMAMTMVRSPLDELLEYHVPKWRAWFESRGLEVHLDPPSSPVVADLDPTQFGVGLDAMAVWRAQVGHPGVKAQIAWEVRDGWIEIRWSERLPHNGPNAFGNSEANWRSDEGASSRQSDLLALPLLARVVSGHGGRLDCDRRAGFDLRLRWPQFQTDNGDGEP